MSDIAERVKKIVVEHLGVDEDKVTESATFIDDLGADSLDTVELVMAFEEEFGSRSPTTPPRRSRPTATPWSFIEKPFLSLPPDAFRPRTASVSAPAAPTGTGGPPAR